MVNEPSSWGKLIVSFTVRMLGSEVGVSSENVEPVAERNSGVTVWTGFENMSVPTNGEVVIGFGNPKETCGMLKSTGRVSIAEATRKAQ